MLLSNTYFYRMEVLNITKFIVKHVEYWQASDIHPTAALCRFVLYETDFMYCSVRTIISKRGQEWTLPAQLGQLKTGQDGKGLLRIHL